MSEFKSIISTLAMYRTEILIYGERRLTSGDIGLLDEAINALREKEKRVNNV